MNAVLFSFLKSNNDLFIYSILCKFSFVHLFNPILLISLFLTAVLSVKFYIHFFPSYLFINCIRFRSLVMAAASAHKLPVVSLSCADVYSAYVGRHYINTIVRNLIEYLSIYELCFGSGALFFFTPVP